MKKLLFLYFFPALVIFSVVFYACQKEKSSTPVVESVSLKEAQMIYGYVENELGRRFAGRYSYTMPLWNNVLTESLGPTHNVMYVPIAYNDSTGNYLHIVVMKDEGRLRSLLVEIQPDKEWRKEHSALSEYKNVTGKLLFYSINGRFHQGYLMKDGSMVKEYTPEQELGNLSTLMRLNQASATSSDPCVYGTFGCQELAEVLVVARPSNQTNYVYIYIPATVYNSNPSGGYYSGYNWYYGGGGGSQNPYIAPNVYLPLQSHWRLCGTYNWKKIGSAQYAQFTSLGFSLVNGNGMILTFMWNGPCIQFGSSVSTATAANDAWNETWNQALSKIQMDANANPPVIGDFQVKQNMKTYIQNYLLQNFSGSTFNPSGCAGSIPYSQPKYCDY